MHLEILQANQQVRELNEIDPSRVMEGHGIGFSAILESTSNKHQKAQIPLFGDLQDYLPKEKEVVVQVEGWVTEILPDNKFRIAMLHVKLDEPYLVIDGSQIETHSSFRRSLRRHIAAN